MPIMTCLSGNEMYCLHKKGYSPGNLVIGNSVFSMGLLGGIGAGLRMKSPRPMVGVFTRGSFALIHALPWARCTFTCERPAMMHVFCRYL